MSATATKHTATVLIESVNEVHGTKKDGSGQYTRFDVDTDMVKNLKTFSPTVGSAAQLFVGASCEIDYTEKVNGQYTDHYLEAVRPAGEGTPPAQTHAKPAAPAQHGSQEWTQRMRDLSILWQVCIKAAAELHKDAAESTDVTVVKTAKALYLGWPAGYSKTPTNDDDIPF